MNTLNKICCLSAALSIFCVTINVINFVNLSLVEGAVAVSISVAMYQIIDIQFPRIPLHFTNRDWHRIMPCIFEKVHDHIRVRNTVKVLGQGICTVIICLITIVTISWVHGESDTNIGSDPVFGSDVIFEPNDQTNGSNPMEPKSQEPRAKNQRPDSTEF